MCGLSICQRSFHLLRLALQDALRQISKKRICLKVFASFLHVMSSLFRCFFFFLLFSEFQVQKLHLIKLFVLQKHNKTQALLLYYYLGHMFNLSAFVQEPPKKWSLDEPGEFSLVEHAVLLRLWTSRAAQKRLDSSYYAVVPSLECVKILGSFLGMCATLLFKWLALAGQTGLQ